jgi:50S ribosomal subunit-associated GTPase HflX
MHRFSIEGYRSVGKTTLINRICGGDSSNLEITDGRKTVQIHLSEKDPEAGYYILVFSCTDISTLDVIEEDRYKYKNVLEFPNKSDLLGQKSINPTFRSALTGEGVDRLMSRIFKVINGGLPRRSHGELYEDIGVSPIDIEFERQELWHTTAMLEEEAEVRLSMC